MLIYGFELEFVIHHDFIESSVVDVALLCGKSELRQQNGRGGGQDVERK